MERSAVDLSPVRDDGTATEASANTVALGSDRHVQNPDAGHAERIEAVVSHRFDEFPADHPYADLSIPRPQFAEYAFEDSRADFEPSGLGGGVEEPGRGDGRGERRLCRDRPRDRAPLPRATRRGRGTRPALPSRSRTPARGVGALRLPAGARADAHFRVTASLPV
jgi:hypothetical protein